jgi:hypothetical protein
MKSDTLFFAALFLTGTGLWTRIAIQGFELGLLSAAIEWSMNRVRGGARFLLNPLSPGRST